MSGADNQELKEFKAFVATQASIKSSKTKTIDWEARKTWWLKEVEELFDTLEDWIKDSPNTSSDRWEYTTHEELIGSYKIEKMQLSIGEIKILFIPIGTRIIGSFGRIDIILGNTKKMLLLYPLESSEDNRVHVNSVPENTGWFFERDRGRGEKFSPKALQEFIAKNVR